jgi:hypothetical protein
MAQPKDIETVTPEPPSQEPAGRVEFDSRGNSVWRWARDVLDSTSILLKRLENKDLALEPTQNVPVVDSKKLAKPGNTSDPTRSTVPTSRSRSLEAEESGRDKGGGFNPATSAAAHRAAPRQSHSALRPPSPILVHNAHHHGSSSSPAYATHPLAID